MRTFDHFNPGFGAVCPVSVGEEAKRASGGIDMHLLDRSFESRFQRHD